MDGGLEWPHTLLRNQSGSRQFQNVGISTLPLNVTAAAQATTTGSQVTIDSSTDKRDQAAQDVEPTGPWIPIIESR